MIKGFRDFILRGNVIDLAVAVVIGAAFAALVKAFTDAFITPLVNTALWAMGMGKDGVPGSVTLASGEQLGFGVMITAIIIFLITAAVIYFVFVVPMNRRKRPRQRSPPKNSSRRFGICSRSRSPLPRPARAEAVPSPLTPPRM